MIGINLEAIALVLEDVCEVVQFTKGCKFRVEYTLRTSDDGNRLGFRGACDVQKRSVFSDRVVLLLVIECAKTKLLVGNSIQLILERTGSEGGLSHIE
jgi:hypothetical protein